MSFFDDSTLYDEHDPRAAGQNRMSLARGAGHMTIWNRRLLGLAWQQRRAIIAMVALGLLIAATFVVQGLLVAHAIIGVLVEDRWQSVPPLLAAAAAIVLVRGALMWWREALGAAVGDRAAADLRRRLYRMLTALGPAWLQSTRTGTVQTTLSTSVDAFEKYFRLFLSQAVVSLIAAVGVVAILISVDPWVGALVGLFACLAAVSPIVNWHALGERLRFWWTVTPALQAEFVDALQGMSTLKVSGASGRHRRRLAHRIGEVRAASMSVLRAEIIGGSAAGALAAAGQSLVIAFAAYRLAQGALSASDLVIVLVLTRECFRPVAELKLALHLSVAGVAAAERIFDVLDAGLPVHDTGTRAASGVTPSLCFRGVSFTYPAADRPAVDQLSFDVAAGETVAIVGPSGAGKTTIVALVLRFFDPQWGSVLLDGADVREFDLASLRSQFALVSQDAYLFHGSVRENLLLARPGASGADLHRACVAANAWEFIATLPEGYETIIGERGARLSGGQRQRLTIARALLKDAPVLVLDEATSSIDVAGESTIQEALDRLTAGRTTLIIAHRLSTIHSADRILVLERGRLVQDGHHSDLAASDGVYRRLVAAQEATT
ncbi:MAG: ATP-binding cassette, subfamily bacterial CydD [Solirubrobacteraceae bacterium]|jgi:ABC-type multidrug transport system fused ATPase/permease subunit|nr:ATP-binding cassette, subfamily bacterial CydD [Solirubrobacteraceae bacterium]